MAAVEHRTKEELEAGLDVIRQSPQDQGLVRLIVRRPETNAREVLEQCELDLTEGLIGDSWRASARSVGGSPVTENQLTIMNSRVIDLVSPDKQQWPLAGDQFFVDLDLSDSNVPAGTRLAIGNAVVEISSTPHTGCRKFAHRFGLDALKFVNSEEGRRMNLRGVNASIRQGGVVHVGDLVRKLL